MNKQEKIIAIIIGVVALIAIVYFVFFYKEDVTQWYWTKCGTSISNTFIEDYEGYTKFLKTTGLDEENEITDMVDYSKPVMKEVFSEEYFKEKKLVVIPAYEDTTKTYIYLVDEVNYNKDKTEATVVYTYDVGSYAGTMASSWYNYMMVEVENTVNSVKFERLKEE